MPRLRTAVRIAALAVALGLPFEAPAASTLGQREIEEALTCQCGCGLTVAACNHLECSFAVPVRKSIAESLARGETAEQILERYKNEYGEKVLSSPVPEGFNILAWITPYLSIAAAGGLMVLFFRRRAHRAAAVQPAPAPPRPPDADGSRLARLQHEVEDLER